MTNPNIEQIFKSLYLRLCEFAFYWTKSEELSKDIVQDAFITLIEDPSHINKHPAVIKSYLYSTIKNMSLNHLRRDGIKEKIFGHLLNQKEIDDDTLDALIRAELISELYDEFGKLPDGCKNVCKLIYFEEKKYQEVANEMNISINTVKAQRKRALRILKEKLTIFFLFVIALTY